MHSMEAVLASDVKTPDLGGKFSTADVTAALIDQINSDAGSFTQDAREKK
jgi:isocitrate/isopropylmalate dehydrogenase